MLAQFVPVRIPSVERAELVAVFFPVFVRAGLHEPFFCRDIFLRRLVHHKGRFVECEHHLLVHVLEVLEYPVVLPDIGSVRHVRREGASAVERRSPELHPVSSHGLQEVCDLLFGKIFGFVAEHMDVGAACQGGRAVE